MSNTVTITGRVATTYLDRGETVTVERTERIDRLIEKGYVALSGDDALVGAAYPSETSEAVYGEDRGQEPAEDDEAPARNASRADWAEFLTGLGYAVGEDESRDDLIAVWDGTRQ